MNTLHRLRINPLAAALGLLAFSIGSPSLLAGSNTYQQTNLVSNIPGLAAFTDSNLSNPWGISFSPSSPFWIADNNTGVSTLYTTNGTPVSLVVTIPPAIGGTPPSSPTGTVFNGGPGFLGYPFIFATEEGTIAGWPGGTSAIVDVDNSSSGADYKGLAIGSTGGQTYLYAADFSKGTIDVFNSNFLPTTLTGNFTDPSLPAGYAPFDAETIGNTLFVTYALQNGSKTGDVGGLGNGFVDEYNLNGQFIERLVSNGNLDSPWGLAVAPAGFGAFGGDLLVGNFGNGLINAFSLTNGAYEGTLDGLGGTPIQNIGLWALAFGNGGSGGLANTLYFTAGIPGPNGGRKQSNGLFASLTAAVPDQGSSLLMLACALFGFLGLRRKQQKAGEALA